MGKIFCIMGKSSTGKDTLYQRILEKKKLGLRQIVLYTTRPIRAGEIDGQEYHFCSEEERDVLLSQDKVIERRSYHTCHGVWDYFTVDDGQIDLKSQNYLVIGTIESFLKMKTYFTPEAVVPIYIEVEDGIRLERALQRERTQTEPKYEEMCRRFLADAKDFSEEKRKEAGISTVFYNTNIDKAEKQVTAYIETLL